MGEQALDTVDTYSPGETTEVQWSDIAPLDDDYYKESIASELAEHAQDKYPHLTKDVIIESAERLRVKNHDVNELELLCAELIVSLVAERLEDEKTAAEPEDDDSSGPHTPGEARARKWVKEMKRLKLEKSNGKRDPKRRLIERLIQESERCNRS